MFECLKGVPLTFKDDLRVVQNCSMGVQGSFIEVSSMFQEGFNEVSRVFHVNFKGVSRVFQRCLKDISCFFLGCMLFCFEHLFQRGCKVFQGSCKCVGGGGGGQSL